LAGLEQTVILVKAWPQPSQKYGETVCCAGVTRTGEWRRLFPIRFRQLTGAAQFKRWDVVEYRPEQPNDDNRRESRRVAEDTLHVVGKISEGERATFFDPLIRMSTSDAADRGESLTLIRPTSVRFRWKAKSVSAVEAERAHRAKSLVQGSLLERELAQIEPCPYELSVAFEDATGPHRMACSDWESAATFFNLSAQYGADRALEHLRRTYEEIYVAKGIVLALGTVKKRPRQWLLLGVIRMDVTDQQRLI
jgi:hypothetical protein